MRCPVFMLVLLSVLVLSCGPVRADDHDAKDRGDGVITFEVSVPDDTPDDAAVFLSGNHAALGMWSGRGLELERGGDGVYRGAAALPNGLPLQFKATRGGWGTVEKDAEGNEIENRRHAVDGDGTVRIDVQRWHDGVDPPPPPRRERPEPTVVGDLRLHQVEAAHGLPGRTVRVWLPPGYEDAANADRRYPVLVMHDGQNLFDAATAGWAGEWRVDETATTLIEAGTVEPVIVVGIDNAGSARLREYEAPEVEVREGLVIGGQGAAYAKFVAEAALPLVEEHYRVKEGREHVATAGSSLGGNVSLVLLRHYPERFGKAGVMSPALWIDPLTLIDAQVPELPTEARVWVDMGDQEGDTANQPGLYVALARRLATQLERHGQDVEFAAVEGGKHTEGDWAARFGEVLTFLFPAE